MSEGQDQKRAATDEPRTWAEWAWPGWVPARVREQVEDFWSERWGRGPHSWLRDMREDCGWPEIGITAELVHDSHETFDGCRCRHAPGDHDRKGCTRCRCKGRWAEDYSFDYDPGIPIPVQVEIAARESGNG